MISSSSSHHLLSIVSAKQAFGAPHDSLASRVAPLALGDLRVDILHLETNFYFAVRGLRRHARPLHRLQLGEIRLVSVQHRLRQAPVSHSFLRACFCALPALAACT